MILFADENDCAYGPVGPAQRPLGIHRISQSARVLLESSEVILHHAAGEGETGEKPTRDRIGVLAHIEEISAGSRDESRDARQQTYGVRTIELKKVHGNFSNMESRFYGRGGIHRSGGNRTCGRVCFSTPAATA